MNKNLCSLKNGFNSLLFALILAISGNLYASDDHDDHHDHEHGHGHDEHEHHDEEKSGPIHIPAAMAQQSGLTTAVAGSGKLQQNIKLYGQVQADPERVRHLHARFPGVIRSVKARIGSTVSAGETLATVEANESLRSYNITSPIDGVVTERHANEGEMTGEQSLFTIVDYRQLTITAPVFARDAGRVKLGQSLRIQSNALTSSSPIASLTPAADGSPILNARAPLDNTKGEWTPGTWVDAAIGFAEIPVALMVDNRALQGFRDWQVVFIQVGDTYEIRPLELGQTDGQFTEVLGGLNPGDTYVVDNSYLLKSDLEKSGASHDH